MDGFGEFPSTGVTEWQNTASVDGFGESSVASVDGTEWLNNPSVDRTCAGACADGTEWQNTPSVDGLASHVVGSETRIGFCVFCSMDTFSVTKHFLRIPIKNVVSLERIFGVSAPMTSICVGVSR